MEKPTLQWAFLTYRMSAGGGVKPTYPTANVRSIVISTDNVNQRNHPSGQSGFVCGTDGYI